MAAENSLTQEERDKLVMDHTGIAFRVAGLALERGGIPGYSKADLCQAAMVGVVLASQQYQMDERGASFATVAWEYAKRELLPLYKASKAAKRSRPESSTWVPPEEAPSKMSPAAKKCADAEAEEERVWMEDRLWRAAKSKLRPSEFRVVRLAAAGLKEREICREGDWDRATVRCLLSRGRAKLRQHRDELTGAMCS